MKSSETLAIAAVIAAVIALPFGCAYYNNAALKATKGVRIENRVLQTGNMISNMEWFTQQVADVRAMDQRLDGQREALKVFEASAGPRSTWTFEDKTEHSRLNAIVAGLEGQRASMVAEYNARGQMVTRSSFRAADLPETLN